MYMYAKKGKLQYIKFIAVDIICILAAFFLGYYLRHESFPHLLNKSFGIYSQVLFVIILSHLCLTYLLDMYADVEQRGFFKEFVMVIKQNAFLMFVFLAFVFLSKQGDDYSRSVYFYFFSINIFLMYGTRIVAKALFAKIYKNLNIAQRLFVITTSDQVLHILNGMDQNGLSEYEVRGIVIIDCDMVGRDFYGVPVVANASTIYEFARQHVVDAVFIHLPTMEEKIHSLSEIFIDMGITVHINIEKLPFHVPNKTVHELGEFTVISSSMKIATPAQVWMKRSIDICGALVGLVLTGIAVIFIGPTIYLESPGPIFFKQQRVGRNGRKFTIYKFRSMYMDAEERKKELMAQNKMTGHMFKMDDDPRITKIGKFIRKTSIDELPQFINVLRGDMSLVGTRPPTVDEYKHYELRHKKRLSMKPGLTGLWQVSGRSNVVDFEKVVQMDAEYISKWSIGLDCRLILKTVGVLLGDRDAC